MDIGEKIKNLRILMKLTQEELADAAGTKKQTIHKYETGIISNIPASKIKLIADKLGTTPSYLMGWDEKPTSKVREKVMIYKRLNENILFYEAVKKIMNLNDEQLKSVITLLSPFENN